MIQKILVLSLLLLSVALFSKVKEDEIILKTNSGDISGTLMYPNDVEQCPIVLIIAGSGPTDRNGNNPQMINNSLKFLAEGLSQNGIASLRYDKRGIGKSAKAGFNERDLRFEHYVQDARDWVKLLAKDTRFSEIIILGHSEGSLIGMIAS